MGKLISWIVLTLALAGPAIADNLNWRIRSEHPNVVSLEFYSQDYSRAWPGDGEVYILDDYDTHSYNLQCQSGETICYGAWVRGDSDSYWGVGLNDANGCSDCCYTCGQGDTDLRILNN
ncbi:hypothetical protein FEE96_18635 [Parasedimentitalea maritima]|uniref:Uncharacterized protein n=1 Tax=Parasedimentitalea maritima TaxID=2578117 RepID=A0ABY2URK5_9RHOB|nr:hypothetical protein [Zongyanglinia marina]TLP58450.1 hypothetical protein FEE96_18635 [Zongyanglinia marina]